MVSLVPVDHDPFAVTPPAGGVTLIPVDHDPFAPAPERPSPFGGGSAARAPTFDMAGNPLDLPDEPGNTMPYGEQMGHLYQAADDTARMALKGVTLGTSDKLMAGLKTGFGFAGDYGQSLKDERDYTAGIEANHPIASKTAEVVGGMLGAGGLAKAGLPLFGGASGGPLWRLGMAAGSNAGLGFGAGMVSHDGSVGDRFMPALQEAGWHAATGAAGAALPVGVGLAYRGARALMDDTAPALRSAAEAVGSTPRATNLVGRAMERDAVTPEAAQEALQRLGPQGMAADLGPNAGQVLESIVQRPGAGQRVARDALDTRHAGAQGRIATDIDASSMPAPVPSRVEAGFQAQRDALGPKYGQAEAAARPMTAGEGDTLWSLAEDRLAQQKGSGQALLSQARDAIAPQVRTPQGMVRMPDTSPDGLMASRRVIDGLIARVEESPQLQREGVGARLQQLRQAVDDQVRALNPDIKALDAAYASSSRSSEAFRTGQGFLSRDVHPQDLADRFGAAPFEQQAAERLGARARLDRELGNTANDVVGLRQVLKGEGDWPRDKMATYFGDEPAGRIVGALDRENVFDATRKGAIGNSRTAARTIADQDLQSAAGMRSTGEEGSIIRSLFNLKMGDAGAKVLDRLNAGRIAKNMDAVGEEGARALTATGEGRDRLIEAMFAKRARDAETARRAAEIEAGGGAKGSMVAAMMALRAMRGDGDGRGARSR